MVISIRLFQITAETVKQAIDGAPTVAAKIYCVYFAERADDLFCFFTERFCFLSEKSNKKQNRSVK